MKTKGEKFHSFKVKGFICLNCRKFVAFSAIGTKHRNHCPFCLWSKHLDRRPGDRQAACGAGMEPIGLAFKTEGGKKQGEIMVVHRCQRCNAVRKNRIAGDDQEDKIVTVFKSSLESPVAPTVVSELALEEINLLGKADETEVMTQLFGKPNLSKIS